MTSRPSNRLTEEEIAREARRVLRRLAGPRLALYQKRDGNFAVARGQAQAAASRVTLGSEFVAAFARQDWIAADGPGRYVLAQEGRAFLIRSFGGEDKFADQHREMQAQTLAQGEGAVMVNVGESPLARLKSRELVDAAQFAAGEKLRRDYTLAQLTPRMGVDFTAPVVSGSGRGPGADSISDIAVAARQRFSRAMAAAGPGLGDLAYDVCCDLTPLERAEARRGWSKRSGRVVLMLALDRLASHYGLTVTAPARGRVRSWSLDETV